MLTLIWLIPLLPLAGAAILGLAGRRLPERAVSAIACGAVALALVVSIGAVVEFATTHWSHDEHSVYRSTAFTWIPGGAAATSLGERAGQPVEGGMTVEWALDVDSLSATMLLVVTGVGFLIFVFATGYMHGDAGYARFFAYMCLFMFSMLMLVLASSLPMLFVGWEGVGLCSYLLIGFWFERPEAGDAAKKAFVANRIGDAGVLLGMFGLFALFGTFDFVALREAVASGAAAPYAETAGQFGILGLITLGLFVGVTGKSAQIPLFVWLPDAMAGPTPVSALIHAATMVTAGVYLLARMSFLFVLTPSTMMVVAIVGVLTALLAAAIAVSQNDIKKVLAYSTVSQLGFMVAACGVGAFAVAIFHVVTHAFFKALLFLGAGSVIHGLGGEQDLTKMGGLRRAMPVTYWTMLAGSAALAGIVPFAGFFSKDAILYEVWLGSAVLWAVLLLTAGLTAFYIARLMILAFFGDGPQEAHEHAPHEHAPHESPRVMTAPLVVLAALSVAGGWVGIGAVVPLIGSHEPPILRWLSPVTGLRVAEGHDPAEYALALAALAVAIGGAALAYFVYLKRPAASERLAAAFGPLRTASDRKFWVDELYAIFPIGFTVWLAKMARGFDTHTVDAAVEGTARATQLGALGSGWVDRRIVDGVVGLVGGVVYYGSYVVRAAQTGLFGTYALAIVVGLAALFVMFEWGAIADYVARIVGR